METAASENGCIQAGFRIPRLEISTEVFFLRWRRSGQPMFLVSNFRPSRPLLSTSSFD